MPQMPKSAAHDGIKSPAPEFFNSFFTKKYAPMTPVAWSLKKGGVERTRFVAENLMLRRKTKTKLGILYSMEKDS